MADEPVPIAVAVVMDGGRVLIGPRAPGKPLAGLWEFPGGKAAPGESVQAAAERECMEETGLRVRVVRVLDETTWSYEHAAVRLVFFEAVPQDPTAEPKQPFVWVAVGQLGQYAFPPANGGILAKLLAANAPSSG